MKILRSISRIIIGMVFIFSGVVKAIDPLGTVYKFQDYFQAFNLSFFKETALFLTIVLCTAEFIAGFSVLFNIRLKSGIWMVMILLTIFTPLTFVLALTNPVSDCGCFGDAIHLSNWQTFTKNIILLIPAIFLFINRKDISPHHGMTRDWAVISIASIFFLAFIFYNLRYLPVMDFLPYKTGTHIPDKMITPQGMQGDKYETTFVYRKSGQIKEFTLENYPASDTTWKFVEQKSVLVSKGYQPPIHDFNLTSIYGDDLTGQILNSKKYTLLMISGKIDEAEPELIRKGFELGYYCMGNNIDFFAVTASGSDIVRKYNNGITFCLADETTLKTMVRSNPGYLLLKDGTILGKWSWANVPDKKKIIELTNKL